MAHELQLQPGILSRIEIVLDVFAAEHPAVRAAYVSRDVDPSYFDDGVFGWEAAARPKLQGLAIESEVLFEFLAFANGIQTQATPIESILNVEELWMEIDTEQPFVFRGCLYHSFPATTILAAQDREGQEEAASFLRRLKYLRGF
jgi:hypothetical protein